MLGVLGLAPDEELVYRALVGRPDSTCLDLAEVLDLPEAEVESALARLVEVGLAVRPDDGGFLAAPPGVALGALITTHRDELRAAEQALATLAEEHRAAAAGRRMSELIEVVTGVNAISHRYLQVQHAAKRELRHFITAPFVAVPPEENPAEVAAGDRGIRIRAVLERSVLTTPDAVKGAADSLRRGVEVRVLDRLPIKLVLADSDLALVPLVTSTDGDPGAVLLQRSGLVTALEALFEALWHDAYPLSSTSFAGDELIDADPDTGQPTVLDRQILALMLGGLTDQAVATQLDVSLRTVQRRLRHLQDLAGVNSRMQLGWYAARRSWA
jgi:predicted transcriptional regulator